MEYSPEALDDLSGRFLTFRIGDALYSIELLHVLEIINVQGITRVPSLPSYIKGITNLRGKVVPVIDVRLKFNMPEQPYNEKTCIIVVLIQNMQVGLIVDSVDEVATIGAAARTAPPTLRSATDTYLRSIARIGEKNILNIDCEKFFQSDLNIF